MDRPNGLQTAFIVAVVVAVSVAAVVITSSSPGHGEPDAIWMEDYGLHKNFPVIIVDENSNPVENVEVYFTYSEPEENSSWVSFANEITDVNGRAMGTFFLREDNCYAVAFGDYLSGGGFVTKNGSVQTWVVREDGELRDRVEPIGVDWDLAVYITLDSPLPWWRSK